MSQGRIAEMGCGEHPLFESSDKVDIYFKAPTPPRCFTADLNLEMPLSGKYDTIIGLEIIEHLYDPEAFLTNCFKILDYAGTLILSTPNILYWKNRIALLFGDDKFFDTKGEHLYFFSPKSITQLLAKCGFRNIEIRPLGKVKTKSLCGGFMVFAKKQ